MPDLLGESLKTEGPGKLGQGSGYVLNSLPIFLGNRGRRWLNAWKNPAFPCPAQPGLWARAGNPRI